MAGGVEVARAFVTIIPTTQGAQESITDMIVPASESAGDKGGQAAGNSLMSTLQSTFGDLMGAGGDMGAALSGGMEAFMSGAGKLAILGAVAAIAAEALAILEEIGAEFDAMTDTIVIGTGASGEALGELKDNATAIATTVSTDFETAGDIVQDFNTRLGLTGEDLEAVGIAAAQLNEITGGINYDQMATMFNVWGTGAEEMTAQMDYLWGVSQATGIGFDQLTSIMQSSAPALQALGFTFEEAANMAGLLDKAGLNSSATMGSLSKALVNLSEPGEDASETFRRCIGDMNDLLEAGDRAAALELATSLFGTKNANQFLTALESGAVSLDAISDSALGASGSIADTYEATADWPEQWQLIKNSVSAALEPLASGVFAAAGVGMDMLASAMDYVWEASEPLRTTLMEVAGTISEAVMPVLEPLMEAMQEAGSSILPVLSGAFEGLAGVVAFAGQAFQVTWGVISPIAGFFVNVLATAINIVSVALQGVGGVLSVVGGIFSTVAGAIETAWSPIGDFFAGITSDISSAFEGLITGIQSLPSKVSEIFERVVSVVKSIPERIRSFFSGLGQKITSAIGSIRFPQPHVTWGSTSSGGLTLPLPSIEWYAKGGIFDGASLIGVGEKGAEAVVPLTNQRYLQPFADAIAENMGAKSISIYIDNARINDDEAMRESTKNFLIDAMRIARM